MNIKSNLNNVTNMIFPNFRNLDGLKIDSKVFILLFFYLKLFFQILILPFDQVALQTSALNSIKLIKSYFYYVGSDIILTYNTVLLLSIMVLVLNILTILGFLMLRKKQQFKFIELLEQILIAIMLVFSKCFIAINCYLIKLITMNNNYFALILPFLNLFLTIGVTTISETFLFSYSFKKSNGLSRNYTLTFPIKFVSMSILVIVGCAAGQLHTLQTIAISFCFLVLSVFELNYYTKNIIYYSQFTSQVYLSTVMLSVSLGVMMFGQYIFPLFKQNFFICLGFLWIFSFLAFRSLTLHMQNQIIFLDPSAIKNQKIAIKYLRALHTLISGYMNDQQSMILASFITKHIRQCTNITCKCKSTTEGAKQLYRNQQFLSTFVQSIIQQVKGNVDSPSLRLMTTFYNVQIVKSYTRFFSQIEKKFHQNEVYLEYSLYCIKETLREKIESENRLDLSIPVQNLLLLEESGEELKNLIFDLIKQIIMRWGRLRRQICLLNQIQQNLIEAARLIVQSHKIWVKLEEKHCFNPQICLIFLFYFRNVVFFDCQVRKVKRLMDRFRVKHSDQQKIDISNIEQFMFSPYNCVIESIVDPNKMGVIKNITKNCLDIFKLQKSKIIDKSVGFLMTYVMAEQHDKMLVKWVETGSRQSLNKLKDTYCVNAQQICFQSYIYVRLLCTTKELKFVVNILKGNDHDYLLLNDKLEVEGYGEVYKNIFRTSKKGACIKSVWPQLFEILKSSKANHQKATLSFREYDDQIQKDGNPQGNPKKKVGFSQKSKKIYQVQIQYYNNYMAELLLHVVKMINYHEHNQESYYKTKNHIQQHHNSKSQYKSLDKMLSSEENFIEKEQIIQYQGTSHTSSIESITQSSSKLVERTLNNIYNPDKMNTPNKKNIIIITIVISVFIISGYYFQAYIYEVGLSSVSNIIFADGAVSDNMQMLQILYNKIIVIHQQNSSTTKSKKLKSIIQSTKHISQQLYNLISIDLQYLMKNNTLSGINFYEYLRFPVQIKVLNTQTQVETLQFMEYFYYSVVKTISAMQNNQTLDVQMINLMVNNWQTMKFINHNNIQFYKNLSISQLNNLKLYLSGMGIFLFITLIVFGILLYKYLTQNLQIKQKLLRTNQYVSTNDIEKYYQYYHQIQNDVHQINQVQVNQQLKNLQITDQKKKKRTNYQYKTSTKKYCIFILAIFLLFALLQAITFSKMFSLFYPCQNMIIQINQLMNSQNYLLESYLQLKSKYLLQYPSIPQNYQFLKNYVSKPQNQFTQIATKSSKMFQLYDPQYSQYFNKVLLTDVCQLIAQYNNDDQIDKCNNESNFDLLSQGILSSMNFFHRQTYQGYLTLQKNSNNSNEFFAKPQYEDVDKYTFFMFRIYQLIQIKMIDGLNYAINIQVNNTYIIGYLMISMICLMILVWILSYRPMKVQLSKIYGYGLFYPPSIINQNKIILGVLQKNLTIQI